MSFKARKRPIDPPNQKPITSCAQDTRRPFETFAAFGRYSSEYRTASVANTLRNVGKPPVKRQTRTLTERETCIVAALIVVAFSRRGEPTWTNRCIGDHFLAEQRTRAASRAAFENLIQFSFNVTKH